MKLYSSAFISIALAFLMLMGKNGQPIEIVQSPDRIVFKNIIKQETSTIFEDIQIEIFDGLDCRRCTEFNLEILPKIRDLVQETDEIDLQLYFIPNINESLYSSAAMSLKCAADQDQFWNMHQKLHEGKNSLNKRSFIQFANELDLETDAFQECMDEEIHQNSIQEDIKYSSERGIIEKPTILINEYELRGKQPFENIQKVINKIRKELGQRKKDQLETFDLSDFEIETEDTFPSGAFELNL